MMVYFEALSKTTWGEPCEGKLSRTVLKTSPLWRHKGLSLTLSLFVPSQDTGDITLSPTSVWKNKQTPSVIVVSQVQNSEMTLPDKLNSCGQNTPKPKSSKISFVPSTISVKGLKPYWDEQCEEINSKLWLPIKTGSHVLDLSSSNGLSNKALGKSWFSSRLLFPLRPSLPTTYSASFMFSHAEGISDEITRTKSVKLYPNQKQSSRQKFFGEKLLPRTDI